MKTRTMVMALCATFAFGTAVADKHEPPKKDERVCTIGWYKNNGLDTWKDAAMAAGTYADLIADLNATGAKAGDTKNAAADYIVANYIDEETCDEATGEVD